MINNIWNRVKADWESRKGVFSNSLFKRTLALQFSIAFISLIAMLVFVNHILWDNQKEKYRDLNSEQIQRVADYVDMCFENVQGMSTQILYSEDAVKLMTHHSLDENAVHRLTTTLQRMANQNDFIEKVFLYRDKSKDVISSGNGLNYIESPNSSESKALSTYLNIRDHLRNGNDMVTFRVFTDNNAFYIAGDFCTPVFLGALIVKLDMNEIVNQISSQKVSVQDEYFILDNHQNHLYVSSQLEDTINTVIRENRFYNANNKTGNDESEYYIFHSDMTELYYGLKVVPWSSAKPSLIVRILLTFLPFIFVYSIFMAIYSIWLSRRIYEPINRLMEITFGRKDEKGELDDIRSKHYRSELEYLEDTFRDTWVENIQNRELIANISNDVLEQLFRSIVIGKSVDSAYINDTMKGLGLEIYTHGRYQVIAGRIRVDEGRELTSMEMSMYRRSLIGFLTNQKNENAIIINFFMDTSAFAVVLGFHEVLSVIQIRDITNQLIEKLTDFVAKLPYSLILGCGKVCNDVESIRLSYQDAYSQVEYLSYVSEDDGTPVELEEQKDYDREYFKEKAQKIAEVAERDSEIVAEEMSGSFLQEIREFPEDKMVSYAELLEDTLVEKMIAVHVDSGEINTLHARISNVLSKREEEEWKDLMLGVLMASVHLIHSSSRRSRYRYVDLAKEYISTHYSDGSLSLNEVSEAVGISAPYLSGIFSEAEQMGFSAYLNNYRVDQAKQFLEQTTMNMTDIGYKCGFNSAQSFNRVFKKMVGFTPGQYRESAGKINNAKKAGE